MKKTLLIKSSKNRYPSPRTTICACSECGEVFPKTESLELHQAVRHAGTVATHFPFSFSFLLN